MSQIFTISNTAIEHDTIESVDFNQIIYDLDKNNKNNECVMRSLIIFKKILDSDNYIVHMPKILNNMSVVFFQAGNKQLNTRELSVEIINLIISKISSNSVGQVLQSIFEAVKIEHAWQTRELALNILSKLPDLAPLQISV